MVSYEKARESLRSTTFGLAIYHLVTLILQVLGIGIILFAATAFKSEFEQAAAGQGMESIKPLAALFIVITAVGLLLTIALMVMHFKNAKKLERGEIPSPLAYYLGVGSIVLNIGSSLSSSPEEVGGTSFVGFIIPILLLVAYGYAIYQYSIYKHKDDDKTDHVDAIIEE